MADPGRGEVSGKPSSADPPSVGRVSAERSPSGDPLRAESDLALLVTAPTTEAELLGAILMERLGPFEVRSAGAVTTGGGSPKDRVTMVFYPPAGGVSSECELLASLPRGLVDPAAVEVEVSWVPRGWVEGWREHFRPVVIGCLRVRPPWEPELASGGAVAAGATGPDRGRRELIDLVINPGLGFGTGLHPTTRGTLRLLQSQTELGRPGSEPRPGNELRLGSEPRPANERLGPLVDVGTGSGILAIAAAKLGHQPVIAFDNDPVALVSAQQNVEANGVSACVELRLGDVADVPAEWFRGATVLANLTLEPVCTLLGRLGPAVGCARATAGGGQVRPAGPVRLVVSGLLAGEQEAVVVEAAAAAGLRPRRRLYEAEWVTLELVPATLPATRRAPGGHKRLRTPNREG
jgi:ribosomal protein L11 methylase PrmA